MVSKAQDFRVSLLGKEIKPVASAKHLGVVLDPSLTYKDHVALTVSSCMARLGQSNRDEHAFATKTFTIIINALVFMFEGTPLNTTCIGSKLCKTLRPVSLATKGNMITFPLYFKICSGYQ